MKLKTNEEITKAWENEENNFDILDCTNKLNGTEIAKGFKMGIVIHKKEMNNEDFEMLQCKIIKHTNELRELQKKHKILTGRNLVVV